MKFNFKKISAVAGAALLTGMSMGFATAASFPQDFTDNGTSGVAVVYGADAPTSSDADQAESIADYLDSQIDGSGSTVVGDNSVQLQRSTDEFNLGEVMNDFYDSVDEGELPTVLAEGTYLNDDNDDFEYEQSVSLKEINLTNFRNRDYQDYDPTIGFHLERDDEVANYSLEFSPDNADGGDDFGLLEDTYIEIMNKEYYISEAENDSGTPKFTLLDSANTETLSQGDNVVMDVGEESYDVTLEFVTSDSSARLIVNGEETDTMEEGDTHQLADGTHVALTDVLEHQRGDGAAQATFSIGTGEIILQDGEDVEMNGEDVDQIDGYDGHVLTSTITNTGAEVERINLEWSVDDDLFITPESELVMPGFEAIKFTMSDFVTEAEETLSFNTGDPLSISTSVEEGDLNLDMFYLNGSEDGFGTNLGAGEFQHLITNSTNTNGDHSSVNLNATEESYFVASWKSGQDAETYAYEIDGITDNDGKNETTLSPLVTGGEETVFEEIDDDDDVGRLRLTLSDANEEEQTATIKVEPISGGDVYTDRVFTAEGLQFLLPVQVFDNSSVSNDNDIFLGVNSTGDSVPGSANTTWTMNLTEEDKDGNIADDNGFSIDVSIDNDDGIEADGVDNINMQQIGRSSDDYIGYVQSELATRVDWSKDTSGLDSMEVTYHGEEAYADVFVSSINGGSTSSAGNMVFMDTEQSDWEDRDVIVVGGSCINSAAADLLGGEYCGDDFENATGAGSGMYVIQTFADAFSDGKVATLVAGYSEADTVAAANKLTSGESGVEIADGTTYVGNVDAATGESTLSEL